MSTTTAMAITTTLKRAVLLAASICFASAASSQTVTKIVRDDTPDQVGIGEITPDSETGLYILRGEEGIRADGGTLVVHSLSNLNLGADDTLLYTEDSDSINSTS